MSGRLDRPTVLWWGRFDRDYSRNAIVRHCFQQLGWDVREFRPALSALGHLEARLRVPPRAELVWVPCFRQRDAAAAKHYSRATGAPLVLDPLISAYDKQVDERGRLARDGVRARRLLAWERARLGAADRVVADTHGHARYFEDTLGVDPARLFVVPVGADESLFRPSPLPDLAGGIEVLFYGSFLTLQGPEVIVEAARHVTHPGARITLLGAGPAHARCVAQAAGEPRLRFEPWLDYRLLAQRIGRAHLLLGVFGATPKAGRVIPNKVYQSLACARPVITRHAAAYPRELLEARDSGVAFVPAADPRALARAIDGCCASAPGLASLAREARTTYERWFSMASVRASLAALLESLDLPCAAPSHAQ